MIDGAVSKIDEKIQKIAEKQGEAIKDALCD